MRDERQAITGSQANDLEYLLLDFGGTHRLHSEVWKTKQIIITKSQAL